MYVYDENSAVKHTHSIESFNALGRKLWNDWKTIFLIDMNTKIETQKYRSKLLDV